MQMTDPDEQQHNATEVRVTVSSFSRRPTYDKNGGV
jgi:hypothetical protein